MILMMIMMMTMTTMKKMTRPSVILFFAALFLVLSSHPCACTQLYGNEIHADFDSCCSDDHQKDFEYQTGVFYECGDPAGRCICQDHTAYCNVSSPALPVLPDDVYVLNLCNGYFVDTPFFDTDPLPLFELSSQFFSHMSNVKELRILNYDITIKAFDQMANTTKLYLYCHFSTSTHYENTWWDFVFIPSLRSFTSSHCDWIPPFSHPGIQSYLQSFSARECCWSTLDLDVFKFFNDLKHISVTSCKIKQIHPAVLPALEELVLDNNLLTSFPKTCNVDNNSFFPSLKRLSLLYNIISQIGGKGSATCLPQVTEIDISFGQMYSSHREQFDFSIQKGVFDAQSCPKLKTINMSQENYVPVNIHTENFIFSNPSIKTLDLTNSGWKFGPCTQEYCVAPNTFDDSSLTHLILDENDFSDVDFYRFLNLFNGLKSLIHLSVEKSNFGEYFGYVYVRYLVCGFNLQYLSLSDIAATACFGVDNNDPCHTLKIFNADNVHSCQVAIMLPLALSGSTIEHISFRYNDVDFGYGYSEIFENKLNLGVLLLDGNDFSNVDAERFVSLFGNLTNLQHFSLSDCGIKHVSAEMFHGFPRLQYLDLSKNKLNTLSSQAFSVLPSLNVLYLHNNVLSVVPEGLLSSDQRKRMTKFTLYQNLLVCSCDNRWLQSWLLSDPDLFDYISDPAMFDYPSQSYSCFDDPTKSIANYTMPDQACMLGQDAAIAIIITSTLTITALTVFSLLFRYRWNFRLLLYYALSNRDKNRARRRNYVYDVFVSYDKEDFQWIRQQLMPELEDRMGLRVCIHQRDFIPGHYIVTNIAQAVEHSKKVLMVFSRHFVLSRWCQFEVDFCLSHVIENRTSLLIMCLDDVASDETLLTGAMKAALSTMTYIQWVNRRDAIHFFWERVRQSLGDVRPRDREAGRRRLREVLDPDARVRIEMQVMDF